MNLVLDYSFIIINVLIILELISTILVNKKDFGNLEVTIIDKSKILICISAVFLISNISLFFYQLMKSNYKFSIEGWRGLSFTILIIQLITLYILYGGVKVYSNGILIDRRFSQWKHIKYYWERHEYNDRVLWELKIISREKICFFIPMKKTMTSDIGDIGDELHDKLDKLIFAKTTECKRWEE